MKFGPIRAVVVDDKPTHLFAIAAGLSAVGIPCMSYWYDKGKNALVPPLQSPHEFLRLIFMDLNLAEMGGDPDAAALEGVVEDVLKQLVAPSGGPYLLVFWTQVTGKVSRVRELLYQRLKGIPKPLDIIEMKKGPFLPTVPGKVEDLDSALQHFFADLSAKLPALAAEVTKLSEAKVELNVVSAWESRAIEAAARSINEISTHARNDATNDAEVSDVLGKVLALIGRAAAGEVHAANDPARALDAGMGEILEDQLSVSVDDKDYQALVQKALSPIIATAPSFADAHRIAAALNTFFHVDIQIQSTKTTDRGVVIAGVELLSEEILGIGHVEFLQGEFLFPAKNFEKQKAEYDAFPKHAELVLVEIGADCDHAQPRPRTFRYLVGYQVPKKFKRFIVKGDGTGANPALRSLGPWLIGGEEIYLVVSTRRFFTWQHATPPKGTVKYRLRSGVVNKLLYDYSTWSSRPGIVEFRA